MWSKTPRQGSSKLPLSSSLPSLSLSYLPRGAKSSEWRSSQTRSKSSSESSSEQDLQLVIDRSGYPGFDNLMAFMQVWKAARILTTPTRMPVSPGGYWVSLSGLRVLSKSCLPSHPTCRSDLASKTWICCSHMRGSFLWKPHSRAC